jgi:YD repeat-containing protein
MASIRVVNEDGEIEVREVISREATVYKYNSEGDLQTEFEPAVTQRVEYDHSGQSSSITSVCGETENRRESDKKPDMTVEGVLVSDQLEEAKTLKQGDEITLVSDVYDGSVFVKRLTIEQTADLVHYIDNGEEKLAFGFQLQLKQPE